MKKEVLSWFRLGIYLVIGVFLSRLVFLTLFLGEYHQEQASGNRIRKERVDPMRGAILDRNGEYLVVNKKVGEKIIRHYPLGEVGAGVTGFVGEISKEKLEACGDSCFL